jgi:hypothetical protein
VLETEGGDETVLRGEHGHARRQETSTYARTDGARSGDVGEVAYVAGSDEDGDAGSARHDDAAEVQGRKSSYMPATRAARDTGDGVRGSGAASCRKRSKAREKRGRREPESIKRERRSGR